MKERDALAAKRRRMPWLAVEKEYRFEGPTGDLSLLDLFEGRRQLIVYRAFAARLRSWSTTQAGWRAHAGPVWTSSPPPAPASPSATATFTAP